MVVGLMQDVSVCRLILIFKCKTFEFTITLSSDNLREELKMAWDTLRPVTVGTVRNDDPASFQLFIFISPL